MAADSLEGVMFQTLGQLSNAGIGLGVFAAQQQLGATVRPTTPTPLPAPPPPPPAANPAPAAPPPVSAPSGVSGTTVALYVLGGILAAVAVVGIVKLLK